ncbi:ankyrin repeat domain-containing protein 30A-like protein [Tanacetum coccineum]
MIRMKSSGLKNLITNASPLIECDDELSRSALFAFRAKEEEIIKKKMEVKERVQAQLSRVEQESKKLAEIRNDLEALDDPKWKEGLLVRKKVDLVNKELKSLGQNCQKKEKEYREAIEAFNEKNKEKAQLVSRLMELVTESEMVRTKQLEELNKKFESFTSISSLPSKKYNRYKSRPRIRGEPKTPTSPDEEDEPKSRGKAEEEVALYKSWVHISEDSVEGNLRKNEGFWFEVMNHMHVTCPITKRRMYDLISGKLKIVRPKVATFCSVYDNTFRMYSGGASDGDYLQKA